MPSTFQKLQIYHSKPLFFFHFLHYLLYIQIPKGVSEFMGLHLMAVVKLKLLASTSHTVSLTPYITSLVAPFVVKTFLNFRTLPQLYEDVLHALRLFLFQFTQIRQLEDRSVFTNYTTFLAASLYSCIISNFAIKETRWSYLSGFFFFSNKKPLD